MSVRGGAIKTISPRPSRLRAPGAPRTLRVRVRAPRVRVAPEKDVALARGSAGRGSARRAAVSSFFARRVRGPAGYTRVQYIIHNSYSLSRTLETTYYSYLCLYVYHIYPALTQPIAILAPRRLGGARVRDNPYG